MAKLTPMMQQYKNLKEQNPEALLFFRLGDFYEMFFDDALIASKELDLVLTARDGGKKVKVPMCGVPHHAVDNYIARLIEKDYKVAICEQMEDPRDAKGSIVERDVVRVITPGTLVDSNLLPENMANYLMAIYQKEDDFGLAYTDISTGQFMVTEITGENTYSRVADEINRIQPAECILPPNLYKSDFFELKIKNETDVVLSQIKADAFAYNNAESLLKIHFEIASLDALGLADMPLATAAAAAILDFVTTTQKRDLTYLNNLQIYNTDSYMLLDGNTRRNLELNKTMLSNKYKGSLLWVCDKTLTALGSRLLREWIDKPLLNSEDINYRLQGVEELTQKVIISQDIQQNLKNIYDLERIIGRISYGNATPKDLISLRESLGYLPDLESLIIKLDSDIIKNLYDKFDSLKDIYKLIKKAIVDEPPVTIKDGNIIKDGYNKQVDELRNIANKGKDWVMELEQAEKQRTGIKSLKVGYNKVFGYYIEVTNSNLDLVPEEYVRKQTLTNCERYITQELKEWEEKIINAAETLNNLEYDLFVKLREQIACEAARIQRTANCIAHIDVLQGLAQVALDNNYAMPQVDDGVEIKIKDGRHPVVEKMIGPENYIANDTELSNLDTSFALITGPNMAGKSTYMRQVALIVLMARIGSFVPASEAHIGKIDRIFTRVGASDDLSAGQSTFMVEMNETSQILRNATKDSLIILDEIGRGTSTYDGLSIAWAVSEYILQPQLKAKTLFATHYHELTDLANHYEHVKNYSVAVKEDKSDIIFLRKIIAGGTDKSYGIQVARLAGLPEQVLKRAKDIMLVLEESDKNKSFDIGAMAEHLKKIVDTKNKEPQKDPIIEQLENLNLNELTPIKALQCLADWQEDLKIRS